MGRESLNLNEPPGPAQDEPAYLDPQDWTLNTSPSLATFVVTPTPSTPENPSPVLQCLQAPPTREPEAAEAMAYQRADPRPFVPRTMRWQDVGNRPTMVRVVASRRVQWRNDDLAIVLIHPLPGNVLDMDNVDEVLREFFLARRVRITEIQDCCLGQAYVRFERKFDRDELIAQGPIPYDNVYFTFIRHNEGRNWRRVHFNTDCWLMLLGFPPDYQ